MSGFNLFGTLSYTPVDGSGKPYANAVAYVYRAGTTTPITVWQRSDLTIAHANPVQADASGVFPIVWADPLSAYDYRVVIKTTALILLHDYDNIPAVPYALTQAYLGSVLYPQTAAEIAAGVTPTNYAQPAGTVDRYGTNAIPGTTDMTAAWTAALAANAIVSCVAGSTYAVSSTIQSPANRTIRGNRAIITTTSNAFTVFNCQGSMSCDGLTVNRAAAATQTSYKIFAADNFVQALPAGTRIVVRDCTFTQVDIGVYGDGGAAENIAYAEVSSCRIQINTSGTGGASSVRPTVYFANCLKVVVEKNPLLDASYGGTTSVNNLYFVGNTKLTISNNNVIGGVQKAVTNSLNAMQHCLITGNRFVGIPWLEVAADTTPIRLTDITDNYFDHPVTQVSDVGCVILGAYTGTAVGGDSMETVNVKGNYFSGVPNSVYYVQLGTGQTFGCLNLTGNRYNNISTSSTGTYGVVNYNATGTTYRALIAANEDVIGGGTARSYLQNGNPFSVTLLTNINEQGLNGTRNGFSSGTFNGTFTGCGTAPTVAVTYTIRDMIATLNFGTQNATSNATSFTLTGLPALLQPLSQTCVVPVNAQDNTAYTAATMSIASGSGTITLAKAGNPAGWTNSGTKGVYPSTVTYLLT